MGRLDEIRDAYFRIAARKLEKPSELEHAELSCYSAYCADISYLLGLLEVHPASELPNTPRDVLAYQLLEGWTKAHYSGDAWRTRNGKFLSDVVCWQEQPVFPKKYVEGARK